MNEHRSIDPRRKLPAVDRLLESRRLQNPTRLYGRDLVRVQAQCELDSLRDLIAGSAEVDPGELDALIEELPSRIAEGLEQKMGGALRRVINATGIFLHTNLGRAPLPRAVAESLPSLLDAYCDLEFDLGTGRRGERNRRAAQLLIAMTGAEAALVTNNNAAAMVLALATLAEGREVIVSRGELIEIGGSFRIPDMLRAAGARLVEVGTTNRTRLSDYSNAIGPETGVLLKVFPSNYRIVGFVEEVKIADLVGLGSEHGISVVIDEGSGLLRDHDSPQLREHPSLRTLLASGADLVCASGDKLLGGPQAGLLVGREELVARCHRHPLYRAFRPDRLCYAALEAVLRMHLSGETLPYERLWTDPEAHRSRLERVARALGASVVPATAFVGGGSAPERPIPGEGIGLPGSKELLTRLRRGDKPVVGYIRDDRLILDLRTVDPTDDETLIEAVRAARSGGESMSS